MHKQEKLNFIKSKLNNLKKLFYYIFKCIVNFVFPPVCEVCGSKVEHSPSICDKCFEKLPKIDLNDTNHKIETIKNIELSASVFLYKDDVKKLIHNFKFNGRASLSSMFAGYLTPYINQILNFYKDDDFILIPVPIHLKRYSKRGYNQSALLALDISQKTGIKLDLKSLKKVKNFKPQASKTKIERKNLPLNTFKCKNINGKSVILIDDILTTGSTAQSCAYNLKKAGAKNVFLVTVAYTPLN